MSDPLSDIAQQGNRKVYQALLDPRFTTSILQFDGKQFICLTLSHPEHGKIDCLVPHETAKWLSEMLAKLVVDVK